MQYFSQRRTANNEQNGLIIAELLKHSLTIAYMKLRYATH